MSGPSQNAAPVPPRRKLDRSSRNILLIFIATAVILGGTAYYVTFFTDLRDEAADAVSTETAAVYNTAAANSTATTAAGMTATAAAGAPTEVPATLENESGAVSRATDPAAATGP
jgi:flagellar basal body-associated protein FliL